MASSISSSISESNSTSLRDVSFSSYLNGSEESYIRTLVANSAKKKTDDGEIDVFSADKYFNGETNTKERYNNNNNTTIPRTRDDSRPHDHDYYRTKQLRTTSNYSESTTSWNSQSTLLKRVQRIPSRNSTNRESIKISSSTNATGKASQERRKGHSSFLLPCSCCDSSSVDVEEETSDKNRDNLPLERRERTTIDDPFVKKKVIRDQNYEHEDLEEGRKSIEVFGSNDDDDHGIIERSLNTLSWDAIPRSSSAQLSAPLSGCGSYMDTESDASSDLFEIECLASGPITNTTSVAYAPSEASVEWSVVTASAADFSVFSDTEDKKSDSISTVKTNRHKMTAPKMSGMLMGGCKSQKAVRVAGAKREKLEKRERKQIRHSSSDTMSAMTRFKQAEAKVVGSGFGQKLQKKDQLAATAVVVPRSSRWSHSSHASELLYIQ